MREHDDKIICSDTLMTCIDIENNVCKCTGTKSSFYKEGGERLW